MIQAAEFDPEPLTLENLRVRDIYAAESIVQAILEFLAGEAWLEHTGKQYQLTQTGRELIAQLQNRTSQHLSAESPVAESLIIQLEAYLSQIIQLSLNQSDISTWCLAHSRNRAPADNATPLLRISQYCSDFNAFRDDAHMAAWQTHEREGYVWETFNLICTNQVSNADQIFEALIFRGYTRADYMQAVLELEKRGWLKKMTDTPPPYQPSETGQGIWDTVEADTDRYFYAPWHHLSEAERTETIALLQEFHDELKDLAKEYMTGIGQA